MTRSGICRGTMIGRPFPTIQAKPVGLVLHWPSVGGPSEDLVTSLQRIRTITIGGNWSRMVLELPNLDPALGPHWPLHPIPCVRATSCTSIGQCLGMELVIW